ncbi:hypothetical protein HPB48_006624 [Haemaphysalis longicornis]|uniref:Uncharacterized protein n=1 Tax=Haemaphysalis longicornis TaxID=44386 RepID=A0A9J6GMD7_HAELO|nr:hypothetical protein HPB48_006624 [Haemaphysalis longicornis]
MRIITYPAHPTLQGSSVERDTTPDLTITRNSSNSVWRNTGHDLVSDHYVVETLIQDGPTLPSTRCHNLVGGDVFRSLSDANLPDTLEDLDDWTAKLLEQRDGAAKTVPEQAHLDVVDSRLLHLWEAKEGLVRRLQRQKHNRPLRRRLAKLNQDISKHATNLTNQHWNSLCDRMEGNMNVPQTWDILRGLLNPEKKERTKNEMITFLPNSSGSE